MAQQTLQINADVSVVWTPSTPGSNWERVNGAFPWTITSYIETNREEDIDRFGLEDGSFVDADDVTKIEVRFTYKSQNLDPAQSAKNAIYVDIWKDGVRAVPPSGIKVDLTVTVDDLNHYTQTIDITDAHLDFTTAQHIADMQVSFQYFQTGKELVNSHRITGGEVIITYTPDSSGQNPELVNGGLVNRGLVNSGLVG